MLSEYSHLICHRTHHVSRNRGHVHKWLPVAWHNAGSSFTSALFSSHNTCPYVKASTPWTLRLSLPNACQHSVPASSNEEVPPHGLYMLTLTGCKPTQAKMMLGWAHLTYTRMKHDFIMIPVRPAPRGPATSGPYCNHTYINYLP